ncbi:flavin reductase [Cohaesibacter celericrescens]|uniref:Flavin reductase n=1 Tax=Cohaesibacter celericrescens TaxID=2067669 RepID=A0A2N5XRT8_9HYPH|nr:flavin reductase [Cohaesibacter celericrescens]PLW77128.1 flavin reductase [Cohaesibacter celericrescens]
MSTVSKNEFRDAMSSVCAAVNIITTSGDSGRGGFTATAMCSVSDEPPSLLVCMNRNSAQSALFFENGRFCVNVLAGDQASLSGHFAGGMQDMEERYAAADWTDLETGCPVLKDALVSFDCELSEVHEAGSHNILIGKVVGIVRSENNSALAYFDRQYLNPAMALSQE